MQFIKTMHCYRLQYQKICLMIEGTASCTGKFVIFGSINKIVIYFKYNIKMFENLHTCT